MLVVMDGSAFRALPASQDHKRAYDGDQGPNTGGMGAYCPAPVVSSSVHDKVISRIVEPMHQHLSSLDVPYRGVLFIGLMIDQHDDPYVVEFNVGLVTRILRSRFRSFKRTCLISSTEQPRTDWMRLNFISMVVRPSPWSSPPRDILLLPRKADCSVGWLNFLPRRTTERHG